MERAPYDPSSDIWKQRRPAVAVDVVLLTVLEGELQVALTRREEDPYFGKHALPGRFVRYDEPIETTARLAIAQKGNIPPEGIVLEQLHTFGQNLVRDTRIRTICIVYYALIPAERALTQGSAFTWHPVLDLPEMAFDHADIIRASVEKMRQRLLSGDIVFTLLPKEFTLSELQTTCEILLGTPLDKRNFRKKAFETYALKETGRTRMNGPHRPAMLYTHEGMR